jgi:hypothetical protein
MRRFSIGYFEVWLPVVAPGAEGAPGYRLFRCDEAMSLLKAL